jgi:hypothetical protein
MPVPRAASFDQHEHLHVLHSTAPAFSDEIAPPNAREPCQRANWSGAAEHRKMTPLNPPAPATVMEANTAEMSSISWKKIADDEVEAVQPTLSAASATR